MYYDLCVLHCNECVQDEYQAHYDILERFLNEYSTYSAFRELKNALESMRREIDNAKRDASLNASGIGYETNVKLPLSRSSYENAMINIFITYMANSSSFDREERAKKCVFTCLSLYYHLLGRQQYFIDILHSYDSTPFNLHHYSTTIEHAKSLDTIYGLYNISSMVGDGESFFRAVLNNFFEDYKNYYSSLYDIYHNYDKCSWVYLSHTSTSTPNSNLIQIRHL